MHGASGMLRNELSVSTYLLRPLCSSIRPLFVLATTPVTPVTGLSLVWAQNKYNFWNQHSLFTIWVKFPSICSTSKKVRKLITHGRTHGLLIGHFHYQCLDPHPVKTGLDQKSMGVKLAPSPNTRSPIFGHFQSISI